MRRRRQKLGLAGVLPRRRREKFEILHLENMIFYAKNMLLERFLNVVQTILTQNPQNFFGLRPDHGFPPLNEKSQPIRGGEPMDID